MMTLLRMLYLKRNQLILCAFILSGVIFLSLDYFYKPKWHCWDNRLEQYHESRGNYVILYNYVVSTEQVGCKNAVTYCTHADVTTLKLVKAIARVYNAPISVAVYSPGKDFVTSVAYIAQLRACFPDILTLVTFHMVFDIDHFPASAGVPLFKSYKDETKCKFQIRDNTSIINEQHLSYPINLLRNVARDGANTHFILSVDLPLVPPRDFSTKFMYMISRLHSSIQRSYFPAVFVLPAFTIGEYAPMPSNKSVLSFVLTKGDGDVYQHLDCSQCHTVPNMSYKKWLQKGDYHSLGIAFVSKRALGWQPFFVGTHSDPGFDERYLWRGIKDRQSQMYAMCTADYNFLVLDNAYLIYRKGKMEEIFDAPNHVERYKKYLVTLDRDFVRIFGPNDNCYLTSSET